MTQNSAGTKFDVWLNFLDADPYASSITCPIGEIAGCVKTTGYATAQLTDAYALLPGVPHAYSANINGYVAVVPEPTQVSLMVLGLGVLALAMRRRRSA